MDDWILLYLLYATFISYASSQLIVNVKNRGDEVLQETIDANTTQDTITLEFLKSDGTEIVQFIDFKNEIQIFRAIILGEEELGQTGYQVVCFVSNFIKNEFISSDAMSKLRQKNPSAIRHPEEDKGEELIINDMTLDIKRAGTISPYIPKLCKEAPQSTYAREADLTLLSKSLVHETHPILAAGNIFMMQQDNIPPCRKEHNVNRPCICSYKICVGWYPCGLKYCHGKDSVGKVVNYRCGIKTCQKCRTFEYQISQKSECMWDYAI